MLGEKGQGVLPAVGLMCCLGAESVSCLRWGLDRASKWDVNASLL